jgi:SAM-dependent methyltransferase
MLAPRSHALRPGRAGIDAGQGSPWDASRPPSPITRAPGRPIGAAFFFAVAQHLRFDRNQRLLDVGAGPGILAIGLAPYCGEVVGVDPEPGMVKAARAAAERAGVTVRFVEGRFEDITGKLGAFDIYRYRPRDPLARPRACASSA